MSNDPNLNPSHDFAPPVDEDRSNDNVVILGQLRANESTTRDFNKRSFVVLVDSTPSEALGCESTTSLTHQNPNTTNNTVATSEIELQTMQNNTAILSSPSEFEPEKKLSPLFVFMSILVALCLTTVFAGVIVVFIYSEIGFGLICGGISAAAIFGTIVIGCVPTYKKNTEYRFKSSRTDSTASTPLARGEIPTTVETL